MRRRKKIVIKPPKKKGDLFLIGWGARPRSMTSAKRILNRVSLLLSRLKNDEKTSIRVEYGSNVSNETMRSNEVEYLIYATTCFLEDYLSRTYIIRAEKTYTKYIEGGEKT